MPFRNAVETAKHRMLTVSNEQLPLNALEACIYTQLNLARG